MSQSKLIPKISYKGVFIFILILFLGVLLLPTPLKFLHLSDITTYFISAGISASVGLSLVLTVIDGNKQDDKPFLKKRIIISTIVGFATSALIILIFGGDLVG